MINWTQGLEKFMNNFPFSIPIGEGSFQGLKCSKDNSERFACKECLTSVLVDFFYQERQRVIDALKLERKACEDGDICSYATEHKGWNAAVDELNQRIEELEK